MTKYSKYPDPQRTQLRFPGEVYRALKEAAEKAGRSLNAELVYRLEASFGFEKAFEMPLAEIPDSIRTLFSRIAHLEDSLRKLEAAHEEEKPKRVAAQKLLSPARKRS